MKVLWVTNLPTPEISREMGSKPLNVGGWLVGLINGLRSEADVQIAICFPDNEIKTVQSGRTNGIEWYAIPFPKPFGFRPITYVTRPTAKVKADVASIVKQANPEILHIFGTEIVHSFAAAEAFGRSDKTLIHLQGVLTFIVDHYFAGIPRYVRRGLGPAELIRGTIHRQWRILQARSVFERRLLANAKNVAGRTEWDLAATMSLSPQATYYEYGEILRDEFYIHAWSIGECERNSLFFSAATAPLKGLHLMLRVLPAILRSYPDTILYVAGNGPPRRGALRLRPSSFRKSYFRYVEKLIGRLGLSEHVIFTGPLDEKRMCERYLKSHAFVCASAIENSSNSVGEAMILGVPTVASDVGGTTSLMGHGCEGYLYPADEPYMLAHYVCKIFSDDELATSLGTRARDRARRDHDQRVNTGKVIDIYRQICATE